MKYTSKSRTVDAIQWTGENTAEVKAFAGDVEVGVISLGRVGPPSHLYVPIFGGDHNVFKGDWIVRSPSGKLYRRSKEMFSEHYAPDGR